MRSVAISVLVLVLLAGVTRAADDLPFALWGDPGVAEKAPAAAAPACPAESVFGRGGLPPPMRGAPTPVKSPTTSCSRTSGV